MKKIITLILAAGLVTTAAFAQDHRHSYDNSYNVNGYPNQYPSYNAYGNYDGNWHQQAYSKPFGYERHDRDWDRDWDRDRDRDHDRWMMYRYHRRHYDDYYRNRNGLSLQFSIGDRRRF